MVRHSGVYVFRVAAVVHSLGGSYGLQGFDGALVAGSGQLESLLLWYSAAGLVESKRRTLMHVNSAPTAVHVIAPYGCLQCTILHTNLALHDTALRTCS